MTKKRLLTGALALALVLLMPVTLLLCGAGLPSCYGDSYYAVLADMERRLADTQGKKIVLLGGSNVAFGADTALMETLIADTLGERYAVCPFGLYGAVGTGTMLSLSAPHLGEGDLVVLCFEPTAESQSNYFGAVALWKCAEDRPDLLLSLTADQKGAMAGSYLSYLQERAAYAREGTAPQPTGAYTRAAFNSRCDMVYDRPGNLLPLGFDTAVPVEFSTLVPDPDFAQAVRSYVKQAERAGARVVLSFSPVDRACADLDGLEDYFSRCLAAYGVSAISDPRRYVLDCGWFYDSNFHLNSAGARLRSILLTEDILGCLGCYKQVDCPLPELPPSAAVSVREEDPLLAADFTFRPVEGGETAGWVVSGLTSQGQGKGTLRVPSGYGGGPVVGFDPGVFAQAPDLEEIILPETVELIPDGAFAGCPALKRLILLHESRTPGLGDAPFAGADGLTVYIPGDAWPMYREGFGCAVNPWEPYLDRLRTMG